MADIRLWASLVLLKFSFSPNEARRTLPDSFCGKQTSLQIVHGHWEVKRLLVHTRVSTRYVIKL